MRRLVASVCALRFFDTFLLIAPFYTVMFAEHGLSPGQVGSVLFAWSATALVLQIPSGVLADHVSRRWQMAVGQLLRAVGLLVWIVWPTYWGFLVGMMLWGLKSAAQMGAFEAVVYDELKRLGRETEYARVTGKAQAWRFAALVLASVAAAAVTGLGYPVLIVASAVASVAAAAAARWLPSAPRTIRSGRPDYLAHLAKGARQAASLPGVPALMLFIAGSQTVAAASADYWQLFGREVGLAKPAIALFIAAWGVSEGLASVLAHRLRGFGLRALFAISGSAGLCLTAAALTFETWSVALIFAYVALFRLVDVNADAHFQHRLAADTRATVAGLKGFAMQCGTATMMLVYGLVAEAGSYRTSFLTAGVLATALGAGFALFSVRAVPRPAS